MVHILFSRLFAAVLFIALAGSLSAHGQRWESVPSGTTSDLYDIQFPSRDTGYALGADVLLRTVNAGATWTTVHTMQQSYYTSLLFTDSRTGFIAGDSYGVYATGDGGDTWTAVTGIPEQAQVRLVRDDLWFAFRSSNNSTVTQAWRSTDQGNFWEPVEGAAYLPGIDGMHFPTPETGYLVFRPGVLKTTDTGRTWTEVANFLTDQSFPFSVLESCWFTSADTGCVAGTYVGALSVTTDGGATWQHFADKVGDCQLNDVYFPSSQIGYAVGWYGELYTTTDGGASWALIPTGLSTNSALYSTTFTDDRTGYAVGQGGLIIRTTNEATSVADIDAKERLVITPNPTSSFVTVSLPAPGSPASIHLFSAAGRCVYSAETYENNHQIDLATLGLSAGLYCLAVTTDGTTTTDIITVVH